MQLISSLALCAAMNHGLAAEQCAAIPSRTPMPREALPLPVEIPDWQEQTAAISKQMETQNLAKTRLVFIGDSITRGWEPFTWNLFWSAYSPLNLGLSGDLTQGVLWRLHNGEWPTDLKPDLAVILIGTNNASRQSQPADTALGIAEIIRFIRVRSPSTKILLLGILPRGPDSSTPERPISERVNAMIQRCVDHETVFFADPGSAMIDEAGYLSKNVMFDYLHPTMVGYSILGARIYEEVNRLLNQPRRK